MTNPTTLFLLPGDYRGLQHGPIALVTMDKAYAQTVLDRISDFHKTNSAQGGSLCYTAYHDNRAVWLDAYALDSSVPGMQRLLATVSEGPQEMDPTAPAGKHLLALSRAKTHHNGAALAVESMTAEIHASPISPGYVVYTATLPGSGKRMNTCAVAARRFTHLREAATLTVRPQTKCSHCGAGFDSMLAHGDPEYGTITVVCELCGHEWREPASITCVCGKQVATATTELQDGQWYGECCPRQKS